MQTEMRLRLLRKDNASPSGYEIVGYEMRGDYEKINEMGTFQSEDPAFHNLFAVSVIDHDAVELGCLHDGRWIYDGDIFTFATWNGNKGECVLTVCPFSGAVLFAKRQMWRLSDPSVDGAVQFTPTGRTIHDEESGDETK